MIFYASVKRYFSYRLHSRAKELKQLGVDIIGFHVGLDVQKSRGISVADLKSEIRKVSELDLLISIAGGLNKDRILELIDLPVSIYVVGGAITRSKEPKKVSKEIVNILKGR